MRGWRVLRPYQAEDVGRIMRALEAFRRVLYVLTTAGGKTEIAVEVIVRMLALLPAGTRIVWLTHRTRLVEQVVDRLAELGIAVGIIAGKTKPNPDARVQIASVFTAKRRDIVGEVGLFIIDEAHRTPGGSYQAVLDAHPNALRLGLTATPTRLDGKPLADEYDEIVEGPSPEFLMDGGHISRPTIWSTGAAAWLATTRKAGDDYDAKELARHMMAGSIGSDVVREYERNAMGMPAILFACTVEHGESFVPRFEAIGVVARVISHKTKSEDRAEILASFEAGDIDILVNVNLLTEGVDLPFVRCVIMARPTASTSLYLQMIGRALRRGNVDPVILDHAGNVRHGAPSAFYGWQLETGQPAKPPGPARRCKACGLVVENGAETCACGADLRRKVSERGEMVEDGAELVEVVTVEVARPVLHETVTMKVYWERLRKGWASERAASTPKETTEQRSARSKAMHAARTPEQRSANGKAGGKAAQAAMTPEQRSANGKAGNAGMTTEQRSAWGKAGNAAMTTEQRSARGKAARVAATRYFATRSIAIATIPNAPRVREDFKPWFAALPAETRERIEVLAEERLAGEDAA